MAIVFSLQVIPVIPVRFYNDIGRYTLQPIVYT